MYNDILKKVSYCVSDSQYNCQKSTCSDSESELHWCTTVNEFSSAAVWYRFVQMKHYHWTEQEWPLSERSECTKQAAVDQSQEQNWHQHSQKQKQQHKCCTRQKLYKLSAQRHLLIWHLHNDSCCCCCCWACHTKVSAEIFNQERFHIQKIMMKKLKKKEKKIWEKRWGT